jgi:HK97 family phage portal protein
MLRSLIEKRDVSVVPAGAWRAIAGMPQASGINVTPAVAMTFSAVFAAHKILAESTAMLPLFLMRRTSSGKSPATDQSLYGVLHDVANPEMDAYLVRETMTSSMVGRGFAIGIVDYDTDGAITALWPVPPGRAEPARDAEKNLIYKITMPDGQMRVYPKWRILHLRGMSPDGINSYSPITLQRQGIGLALAAETYGASFFGNGAAPQGVLLRPKEKPALKEESAQRLINSWNDSHQGADKANKIALLEEGMDYKAIGISPEDAQFLQTREFQVEEIARWYRIPPPMLAMTDKTATYASVEAFGVQFVTYTLFPWLVRWEKSISAQLLYENQRSYLFAEHLMTAFLRGDTAARFTAYGQARNWGWLSVNDIRALENMNGIGKYGDIYLTPANMAPAGTQKNLRDACLPALADAIQRVIKREVNDVRGAVVKLLRKKGVESFADWLSEFYQEHQDFIVRQMGPASQTCAGIVTDGAQTPETITERVEGSLRLFAVRRAAQAQGQLRDALNEPDPAQAVDAILDGWNEQFSDRLAKFELSRQAAFYGMTKEQTNGPETTN